MALQFPTAWTPSGDSRLVNFLSSAKSWPCRVPVFARSSINDFDGRVAFPREPFDINHPSMLGYKNDNRLFGRCSYSSALIDCLSYKGVKSPFRSILGRSQKTLRATLHDILLEQISYFLIQSAKKNLRTQVKSYIRDDISEPDPHANAAWITDTSFRSELVHLISFPPQVSVSKVQQASVWKGRLARSFQMYLCLDTPDTLTWLQVFHTFMLIALRTFFCIHIVNGAFYDIGFKYHLLSCDMLSYISFTPGYWTAHNW